MVTTTADPACPSDLLDAAYQQLEYDQGSLLSASNAPQPGLDEEWVDLGDWQQLAKQVGADRIFFVDRNPVVVFAKSTDGTESSVRMLYERIWCMARPQLLFLATPGQLSAYDLTKPPPKPSEEITDCNRLITVATSVADVQSKLCAYHREHLETGASFGDQRFRKSLNRSDRSLIRDLKTVRQQLAVLPSDRNKPKLKHLHSLIGRAIFVRYLEDRDILLPAYFERIANGNNLWSQILKEPPAAPGLDPRFTELRFLRVLLNKEFTYALFESLANDFNGDIFPICDDERDLIAQSHLDKLRGFLIGNTSDQEELFFFAYRFDVIPIELISTIYEEFYSAESGNTRSHASHYTPPSLVEHVLAHTLTTEVLDQRPRVVDPACGSGIFLVESFRRMVRHLRTQQKGRRPSPMQLRRLLRDQIAGIDINEEAVRVAAFSLYLAYLHYQEPREINDQRRLPFLKWVSPMERLFRKLATPDADSLDILLHANSFEVIAEKCESDAANRFGKATACVVVGNPPWGAPKKDDLEGKKALRAATDWCKLDYQRPLGDKELSQAFIHLTDALLRDGGRAGLLVSSGVLFKRHENSIKFRHVWLNSARLIHVVNFAHVRHVFFSGSRRNSGSISPFISVVYEKSSNEPLENRFQYWSAKRTAVVENIRSVVLNRGDMHWLSQRDCVEYDKLWKIYWWGGHQDEALIRSVERFPALRHLPLHISGIEFSSGQGFKKASKAKPANWLEEYLELKPQDFRSYGTISAEARHTVPPYVEHRGAHELYHGRRFLVARGIQKDGRIRARFETESYCFRSSIHGFRLKGLKPWQEAVITAVFWSSVSRYYHFLTSGSWGLWHDEIYLSHVESTPIRFPRDVRLRNRIVRVVRKLQGLEEPTGALPLNITASERRLGELERASDHLRELEQELDDAVFDLYEFNSAQRDIVREFCTYGLDLLYNCQHSSALAEPIRPERNSGTFSDLSDTRQGLSGYLHVFLETWKREVDDEGDLIWRILSPPSRAPLLAVSFAVSESEQAQAMRDDSLEWRQALQKLEHSSRLVTPGSGVLVDTFFRYVGNEEILFIKRNEQRFWSRTAAREDVASTVAYLINRDEMSRAQ